MGAPKARSRWTYAEFARLPSDDGNRYEIIDEQLVVTPAPGRRHQRISADLLTACNIFVREHGLGEVYAAPFDVLFGEGEYVEPDLLFVGRDRLDVLSDRGVEGAPDLVAEIVSLSTADRDRGPKFNLYRRHGVREYWIVDPEERQVEAWDFTSADAVPVVYSMGDSLRWTPGPGAATLEVDLTDLFRP